MTEPSAKHGEISYSACRKCGNNKAERYNVAITNEFLLGGIELNLCDKCVKELRKEIGKCTREWLKEGKNGQ